MLLMKMLPKQNVSDFKRTWLKGTWLKWTWLKGTWLKGTWLKDENQKLFLIDKLRFKKSLIKNENG